VQLHGIERILKRTRRAVVLIDEAYYEFCGITALPLIERAPNLFVSRTFSKVFGMAAMRLGSVFSHPANIAFLHKAQSPYSVNAMAALAVQEAVRDRAAERSGFGSLRIHVDELVVLGDVRKGVDASLRHLEPARYADLLTNHCLVVVEGDLGHEQSSVICDWPAPHQHAGRKLGVTDRRQS
jgi:hypothetical protein